MDGARLWQCGPFYGKSFADISAPFDTVYVSLYKDLEGIGGCLIAGPQDFIAEARVWQVRHGGRVASLYPYALSGERGLDDVLPRIPSYVQKAHEIGAAFTGLEGVDVVPDPPQVAMLHAYIRGDRDRVDDAIAAIAEERGVLLGRFGTTQLPNVQRTEIQVGAPTLEIPTDEIAALYAEVVRRAA
jgi:threonine aldolase